MPKYPFTALCKLQAQGSSTKGLIIQIVDFLKGVAGFLVILFFRSRLFVNARSRSSRIKPDVCNPIEVVHIVDVLKGAVDRVVGQLLLQRRLTGAHLA